LPILTAFVAALVLLINLYLYLSPVDLAMEPFDPDKNPELTATVIQMAIEDYAESHTGQFPENLAELLNGGYLASEEITEEILKGFDYSRSSPDHYELRIREKGGEFPDIVYTQEDM